MAMGCSRLSSYHSLAFASPFPQLPHRRQVSTLWPRFDALLPQPAVSLGGGLVVLTGSGFEMGLRIFRTFSWSW